jgi:hypothetical protein
MIKMFTHFYLLFVMNNVRSFMEKLICFNKGVAREGTGGNVSPPVNFITIFEIVLYPMGGGTIIKVVAS